MCLCVHVCVSVNMDLTNAMASLPADGCRALNVGPGGGHVVVPAKLREQVLNEVNEDQVPAGHDQVAKGHDRPLRNTNTRARTRAQA